MLNTMSEVAARFLTGAAPIVRLIPDNTALTFSSVVGVSRPAARGKWRMAAKRLPSVLARRPAEASSGRKAHSDSAEAGSEYRPRFRHHDSKMRKSLP